MFFFALSFSCLPSRFYYYVFYLDGNACVESFIIFSIKNNKIIFDKRAKKQRKKLNKNKKDNVKTHSIALKEKTTPISLIPNPRICGIFIYCYRFTISVDNTYNTITERVRLISEKTFTKILFVFHLSVFVIECVYVQVFFWSFFPMLADCFSSSVSILFKVLSCLLYIL